jgi:hypothetical protein
MSRVRNRGPGDGSFDAVLRAVVVVALLAGAGLALRARQGLDWDALADPVAVQWARVLLGLVLLAAVVANARRMLRRLRRPQLPPVDGRATEPEAEPFPLLLRVLAVALVLAALGIVWFLVDAISNPVTDGTTQPPEQSAGDPGDRTTGPTSWPVVAVVAAVLVATLVTARLLARRTVGGVEPESEPGTGTADAAELAAAVDAAETELDEHDDARAAILAAYSAMAASITAGLSRRGVAAHASDTPTELLERAAAAGLVGDGPAAALTSLFREARFSRHPMGEDHRRAAERALRLVRDELAASRA